MSDEKTPTPDEIAEIQAADTVENMAPFIIEAARSSRSKCKTCRHAIDKGVLRIGLLVEGGFYGPGYMWHHLTCAAKRNMDKVEEAYAAEAWKNAQEVPSKLPTLEELRQVRDKAAEKKAERKEFPYVEVDPSGRARCKACNEPIEKGSLRIVLAKEVTFGSQTRSSPFAVHPKCLADGFENPEVVTEREGLREALLENSGLDAAKIDEVLAIAGPIAPASEDPDAPPDPDAPVDDPDAPPDPEV